MPRPLLAVLRPPATDPELVARAVAGDAAAFAQLVRRHGPLVLGACRRILPVEADAADAFQATFLLFARKAGAVRDPARVGPWLYGVAVNVARRMRATDRRRRRMERAFAVARPARVPDAPAEGLVDAELLRLPERYRWPLLLCGVDGQTMREAAALLGWPPGTVATRLRRGRELLAERLRRRGVAVPLALAAGVLRRWFTGRRPPPRWRPRPSPGRCHGSCCMPSGRSGRP